MGGSGGLVRGCAEAWIYTNLCEEASPAEEEPAPKMAPGPIAAILIAQKPADKGMR
jgi:hypothetical protein